MKKNKMIKLLSMLMILFFVQLQLNAQYNLSTDIISSGETVSGNSDFNLSGTIGQTILTNAKNSEFNLQSGFWFGINTITGIENTLGLPTEYKLFNNYPNPFNPSTTIKYQLKKSGSIKLLLYNSIGQIVATLVNENKEAGIYTINYDASNISSGIYFYRIVTKEFVKTKRMILLK